MKMQINCSILFYDGEKYYHAEDPGILTPDFAELRGTDIDEASDNFQDYSKISFPMDISGRNIHDLVKTISQRMGFAAERINGCDIGYGSFYTLISNELVHIQNPEIGIQSVLDMYPATAILQTYLIFSSQAGDIWRDDGLRYYIHSRESGRHNIPHIHIDYQHEAQASISIDTGEILAVSGRIPSKVLNNAQKRILRNQPFLLNCWCKKTVGLFVDLNYSFEKIVITAE